MLIEMCVIQIKHVYQVIQAQIIIDPGQIRKTDSTYRFSVRLQAGYRFRSGFYGPLVALSLPVP